MGNLNLQDILDMFQNGERRYAEDPAFKAAIDSLKMGIGVYAVLDHVLKEQSAIINIAQNSKANYDAVVKSLGILQKENIELKSVIEQIRSKPDNRMQVLMTREVYPNELQDLRDYKTRTTDQLQKLKDEVASYKDALELQQGKPTSYENRT